MAEVWIPTPLLPMTGGEQRIIVPGKTVRQVVRNLVAQYPKLDGRLADGDEILPGIAVIVDGETTTMGMLEPVQDDSEVHFLPAIGGG